MNPVNAITLVSISKQSAFETRKAYIKKPDGSWTFAVESILQRSKYLYDKTGEKHVWAWGNTCNRYSEECYNRRDVYAFEINDPNKSNFLHYGCQSETIAISEKEIICIPEGEFDEAYRALGEKNSITDDEIQACFKRVFTTPAIPRQTEFVFKLLEKPSEQINEADSEKDISPVSSNSQSAQFTVSGSLPLIE